MSSQASFSPVVITGLLVVLGASSLSAQTLFRNDSKTFGPTRARATMDVQALNRRLDKRTLTGRNANAPIRYECKSSMQTSGTVKLFGGTAQMASVLATAIARQGRGSSPSSHYFTLQSQPTTLTSMQLSIAGQVVQSRSHALNSAIVGYHYRPLLRRTAWRWVGPAYVQFEGSMSSSAQMNLSARAFTVAGGGLSSGLSGTLAGASTLRTATLGGSPSSPGVQARVFGSARLYASGLVKVVLPRHGSVSVIESRIKPAVIDARPYFGASNTGFFGQVRLMAASLVLRVKARNRTFGRSFYRTLFDSAVVIAERALQMK